MALGLALGLAGCELPPMGDCDNEMHFELHVELGYGEEVDAARGVAAIEGRVFAKEWDSRRSGCAWTATSGRAVSGGGADDTLAALAETTYTGHYEGVTTGYASAYEISCEGNSYVIPSPAAFAATLSAPVISVGEAVDISWAPAASGGATTEVLVIEEATGQWLFQTSDYGSGAGITYLHDSIFPRPGAYTVRMTRILTQEYVEYVGEGNVTINYDAKLLVEP